MKRFLLLLTALFPSISVFPEGLVNDSVKNISLQEVEIVSTRASDHTPVAYSKMDKEMIGSVYFGQDIPYILLLTPSVVATSDAGAGIGYTGFRIRGTDANRINVTINGIPLNDSESHGVFWVNMPDLASSLEDIQIQRGVGTSTHGTGAFGASINMKTEKVPLSPYGEINGGYGSFNTSKVTLKTGTGVISDHWAFDTRLSSIHTDGFIDRANVDLKSYFFQGAYFNKQTLIKYILLSGKEKTYHAWDGVPEQKLFPFDSSKKEQRTYNPSGYIGEDTEGNPMYYPNQTDNYDQTHYLLSLLQVLNPFMKLNVSLHYTKGFGYYEQYRIRRTLKEFGLQSFELNQEKITKSDLIRQKHLDNDFGGLVFSLDYEKNKLDFSIGGSANQYNGNHFGKVIWVKNYAGDPFFKPSHEYYRNNGKKTDFTIYVKGNYLLTEQLRIYGDVQFRGIDYSIKGAIDTWDWVAAEMKQINLHEIFSFFNPKAGLYYRLNPENIMYGSFAIAHREPNRSNYTDAQKEDIPQPEQLIDYELGYRFKNKKFDFSTNLYYMKYKDQLVLTGKVNETGRPVMSNVPDSYRAGIELAAGARLIPCLDWNGNLTLSRNKILNHTEYVTVYDSKGNPETEQQADFYGTTNISFSPGIIVNNLFTFKYKLFTVGLHSIYVGKQYLDNTGRTDIYHTLSKKKERSIDAYNVNNLRLSYDFSLNNRNQLSVNLSVNNLFNAKYETNGWIWSCYYRQADGSLEPYTEKSYFPQAGIHVMTNVSLRF